jgi:hypothetical protein
MTTAIAFGLWRLNARELEVRDSKDKQIDALQK